MMNFKELALILNNYSNSDSNKRFAMHSEAKDTWNDVLKEFTDLCRKDPKLKQLKTAVDTIYSIIYFNEKENFKTYAYTANEGLGEEFEEDIYKFNKKDFQKISCTACGADGIFMLCIVICFGRRQ